MGVNNTFRGHPNIGCPNILGSIQTYGASKHTAGYPNMGTSKHTGGYQNILGIQTYRGCIQINEEHPNIWGYPNVWGYMDTLSV